MIITCERCGTRFNLDDSLLAGDAVKVRCSRCQHLFSVPAGGPNRRAPGEPQGAEIAELSGPDMNLPEKASGLEPGPRAEGQILDREALVEESLLLDEPGPSAPESGDKPKGKINRTVIFASMSGCLLVLLLTLLALWYFEGEKAASNTQETAAPSTRRLAPPLPPAAPEELRNLVVTLHDARYQGLVNDQGGQMLVIQGEVKNLTGETRGPISLKATLTDPLNQPVQELLFYSGTSLTDEELLHTDPKQIKRWLTTPGGREGARFLKAGVSQPFTAVMFGVPDNLAEARYGFNIVVSDGPRVPIE